MTSQHIIKLKNVNISATIHPISPKLGTIIHDTNMQHITHFRGAGTIDLLFVVKGLIGLIKSIPVLDFPKLVEISREKNYS